MEKRVILLNEKNKIMEINKVFDKTDKKTQKLFFNDRKFKKSNVLLFFLFVLIFSIIYFLAFKNYFNLFFYLTSFFLMFFLREKKFGVI